MASKEQVRQYLSYWFQLGKKVILGNSKEELLPQPIFEGDRYSQEFERCWQLMISPESVDCYLDGTSQTIKQLLSSHWDIQPCSRCDMPVAIVDLGIQSTSCPCHDIPNWPNTELPAPRTPVKNSNYLNNIRERLSKIK